jgi:glycerol kinase
MKYSVEIDEVTTECKTSVFDRFGNSVSCSSREYASYYPKSGYVEQVIISLIEEIGANIKTIRLCGGVTKSEIWCQMFSDILNKNIELTEVSELVSLGDAMCADIGLGLFYNNQNAINHCVKIKKRITIMKKGWRV